MKKMIVFAGLILVSVFASCEAPQDELVYELDENGVVTETLVDANGISSKVSPTYGTIDGPYRADWPGYSESDHRYIGAFFSWEDAVEALSEPLPLAPWGKVESAFDEGLQGDIVMVSAFRHSNDSAIRLNIFGMKNGELTGLAVVSLRAINNYYWVYMSTDPQVLEVTYGFAEAPRVQHTEISIHKPYLHNEREIGYRLVDEDIAKEETEEFGIIDPITEVDPGSTAPTNINLDYYGADGDVINNVEFEGTILNINEATGFTDVKIKVTGENLPQGLIAYTHIKSNGKVVESANLVYHEGEYVLYATVPNGHIKAHVFMFEQDYIVHFE